MSYRTSSYGGFGGGGFGGFTLTPWVKRLLIANAAIFVVAWIVASFGVEPWLVEYLAFEPRDFLFQPWTLLTYAFLHLGLGHIFFNMLALFFFGPMLEERWGSRGFIRFYLVAAAGSALFATLEALFVPNVYVLGASGAIYGLMMAFALTWPEMPIHVWGIFPVKAKWLVGVMAVVSILLFMRPGSGVSHMAHLGGFATAFLYLRSPWAPSPWGETPPARRKKKRVNPLAALIGRQRAEPAVKRPTASVGSVPVVKQSRKAERELLDDVDRILDKISQQGLGSLTTEERQRLDEVSRRYRTN